jgi:hypothetical protein
MAFLTFPRRTCSALRLLAIIGLALAAPACGPTLRQASVPREAIEAERERQREIAFATLVQRQDRLLSVSMPLLMAAAELCEGSIARVHGFTLHDRRLYAETLGREYERVAARHFGLGDQVAVRYVHPGLPAASAGLKAGDRVLALDGQDLRGKSAPEAMGIVRADRGSSEGRPLSLRVERDGQIRDLEIQGVPACDYRIQLINHDAVNAFADGTRVGIHTGMVRFAESDGELALVVGHEIAHNALGHIAKRSGNVLLGSIFDVAIAVILGVNTGGLLGDLAGRAFSQSFEAEADYAGLYIVARAGYDISRAANFWRRMAVEHPGSIRGSFLSTHPSTPERFLAIENSVREIEEKRQQGKPLMPDKK